MSGAELIAAERQRQIDVEGWSEDHDDEHGRDWELVRAAQAYVEYAIHADVARNFDLTPPSLDALGRDWPWDPKWWKPSDDPIRNLVKAGALIAAEIDRLQRAVP